MIIKANFGFYNSSLNNLQVFSKIDMSQKTYPYSFISHDTLTLPASPIPYCFPPNCPHASFPLTDQADPGYSAKFANKQQSQYELGLDRYLNSRQVQRDYDPYIASPVFNSNQSPLSSNYMSYDLSLETHQKFN
jgi:hypothetical protein